MESGVGAAGGSWEWSGEFLSVLFLISIFFFFSHFYFQESLQLAFEVSELDRLAAWGLEGGAGPVGVAVSAFFGASLPKISLCGWPALLPPCYFLIWVDSLPALTRPSPSGS